MFLFLFPNPNAACLSASPCLCNSYGAWARSVSTLSSVCTHTHAFFVFVVVFFFVVFFFFMFCFFAFVFHPACDLPVRLPSTGCVRAWARFVSPPLPRLHTRIHTRALLFFVFDFLFCFLLCITSLYLLIRAAHYLLGRDLHFSRADCS